MPTSSTTTVVDSKVVIVQNGTVEFRTTIKKNGTAVDLTGKTVTATIRRESTPDNVLNSAYEDIAVTNGNADTAATAGGVTFSFSPSSTYFTVPKRASDAEPYLVQLYIVTDDYYPQLVRFGVRKELN